MKKLIPALVAVVLAGLVSCGGAKPGDNAMKADPGMGPAAEVSALMDTTTKSIAEANDMLTKATDSKGVVAGLDKFVSAMKDAKAKGEAFDKKYPDMTKTPPPEVKASMDKVQKASMDFSAIMGEVMTKYGTDPDVMAKLKELQDLH